MGIIHWTKAVPLPSPGATTSRIEALTTTVREASILAAMADPVPVIVRENVDPLDLVAQCGAAMEEPSPNFSLKPHNESPPVLVGDGIQEARSEDAAMMSTASQDVLVVAVTMPIAYVVCSCFLLLVALAGAVFWRRRCCQKMAPRLVEANNPEPTKRLTPTKARRSMRTSPLFGSEYDTDSTSSYDGSSQDNHFDPVHHSRSVFAGHFPPNSDELETFENEPLQEIIVEQLQMHDQTRDLLFAMTNMFSTCVEENRNSVQWMIHQEMQSRDERLSACERSNQEQCAELQANLAQFQREVQEKMEAVVTSSATPVQQQSILEGLLQQVSRLEEELKQEREILDKAVVSAATTTEGGGMEKNVQALVARVQALEALLPEPSTTNTNNNLEERIRQLERELQQDKEKKDAAAINSDLLLQKSLADLSSQIEELEDKLEDTKDIYDATTSILETRLELQNKAQEKAVEALASRVDNVAMDLTRVENENKDSIAQVKEMQDQQAVVMSVKLQALEEKLSLCQEEWKTVLQGLQTWDDKLAAYKKSQENAKEELSCQLGGLQWELKQAQKETEEKFLAIKASAALAAATIAAPLVPQDKTRPAFWKSKFRSTKPTARVGKPRDAVVTSAESTDDELEMQLTEKGVELVGVSTDCEL